MTINFDNGLQWLQKGKSVSMVEGQLVADNFKRRIARYLSPKFNAYLVDEVAKAALENNSAAFGNALVARYAQSIDSKNLVALDLKVAADNKYNHPKNQNDLARWERWGFDTQLFVQHHDFVRFMLTTPLGSQMKLFNSDDFVQPDGGLIAIVEGEPAIIINGERVKFSTFKAQFKVDEYHGEKVLTRQNDEGATTVWTYLANGKGLQEHHPYLDKSLVPVAILTKEAFERTVAQTGDPQANLVLQVVSSHIEGNKSNAVELLKNRKHPWVRLITKNEDGTAKVYDFGFGWVKPSLLPGRTGNGRFRNMDIWNYQTAKERIVTSAAIDQDQYNDIVSLVNRIRSRQINLGQSPAFNLFRQNCSAFVGSVGGIVPQLGINTRITLPDLMHKLSPEWVKKVIKVVNFVRTKFHRLVAKLPKPIVAVARAIQKFVVGFFDFIASIPANIISFLAGGASGSAGAALNGNGSGEDIGPVIFRPSLKSFFYHLPGMVQEWQLKQGSTSIFKQPVAMVVAPPVQ